MMLLNLLKNNDFCLETKNFRACRLMACVMPCHKHKVRNQARHYTSNKKLNLFAQRAWALKPWLKDFQPCLYHSNVQEKKHALQYPNLMLSFFENCKNQNKKTSSVSFSLFKLENSSISLGRILTADTVSRKKRKSNMQISLLKKITCSYTGKDLVSSPTELSVPLCALTFLSGQSCTIVWATKSISSWKLRKNSVIGCKVTLRRKSALFFLDRLYVCGREGLLEKKKNLLNQTPFSFGILNPQNFLELQKSDRLSSSFSGFSISIN